MKTEELTLAMCLTASLVLSALVWGHVLDMELVYIMIPATGGVALWLIIKLIESMIQ